jgi:hypothetical protein
MSHEHKLLQLALRMALRNPQSVGQRGLSIVLGANRIPQTSSRFERLPRAATRP